MRSAENVYGGSVPARAIRSGPGQDDAYGSLFDGVSVAPATAHPSEEVTTNAAKRLWRSLTLVRQFTLASSALVLAGLGVLGAFVSSEIREGIKTHVAERTALYVQSSIAPLLQDLWWDQRLSDDLRQEIDYVIARDAARMHVAAIKVWARSGVVIYATDRELVGRQFSQSSRLKRAWAGKLEIEFDDEPHLDHTISGTKTKLLEIYVPIRHIETGDIIGVVEFYETAEYLDQELLLAELKTWIVTALVSFSIIGGMYTIVAKGSKMIEMQRASLANRITLLSDLLRQNEELRNRVQQASYRSAEGVELHLCRLGSDLHDGPAQLLALALLKLDQLLDGAAVSLSDRESVRGALSDAMAEIRDISAGLALPELKDLSLTEALTLIVAGHERRTATIVSCDISVKSIELSHPTKLCLCRFVQEGLNNAFRYAGGVGQSVSGTWTDELVMIEVSDRGTGFDPTSQQDNRSALGLVGLRNRLESLGGYMTVNSEPGRGTRLTAFLTVNT